MNYFTADFHLGDKRQTILGRPFKNEYDCLDTILSNFNEIIKPEDILYVLGDVATEECWLQSIDEIDCEKILIKGNHEILDKKIYEKHFIEVYDYYNHSLERLSQIGIKPANKEFHLSILVRRKLWELYGKPDLCGEPGLPSIPCVSELDCKILGVKPNVSLTGQRTTCKCLSNKFELLKKTRTQCLHSCNYCYLKKDSNKTLF